MTAPKPAPKKLPKQRNNGDKTLKTRADAKLRKF